MQQEGEGSRGKVPGLPRYREGVSVADIIEDLLRGAQGDAAEENLDMASFFVDEYFKMLRQWDFSQQLKDMDDGEETARRAMILRARHRLEDSSRLAAQEVAQMRERRRKSTDPG